MGRSITTPRDNDSRKVRFAFVWPRTPTRVGRYTGAASLHYFGFWQQLVCQGQDMFYGTKLSVLRGGYKREWTMKACAPLGRFFFVISMALWSVQLSLYACSIKGPLPSPPWNMGSRFWALSMGAAIFAASVCLAFQKKAHLAAELLATLIFLRVLVYIPGLAANIHNVGDWTYASELLAMCAASLVLAGSEPTARRQSRSWEATSGTATIAGRVLFGATLVVFGVEHFLYARDVGTMIPSWIPWHLFWAYFVGVAFIAAATSLMATRQASLAAILLGVMFFLWVVILWAPAVVAAPHDGFQWTNAFITLGMSGGAFALVGSERRAPQGSPFSFEISPANPGPR